MKTTNAQRKINIIKNIEYLMRTRGETKASFSNRTGLTRTTIYKILDGRVNNVQQATVTGFQISLAFPVKRSKIMIWPSWNCSMKRSLPKAIKTLPQCPLFLSRVF